MELISIPMPTLEREHYQLMYNNIHRIPEQTLVDQYTHTVERLQTPGYTDEEMKQLKDIYNILYCELIDRAVEFEYGDENETHLS